MLPWQHGWVDVFEETVTAAQELIAQLHIAGSAITHFFLSLYSNTPIISTMPVDPTIFTKASTLLGSSAAGITR
jgi:hypothetical protein